MGTLKSFEKCVLEELLAKLRLEKAKQEFGNDYVFGFDDVERILTNQIEILDEKNTICKHCWSLGYFSSRYKHKDCTECCACKTEYGKWYQETKGTQCVKPPSV